MEDILEDIMEDIRDRTTVSDPASQKNGHTIAQQVTNNIH